MRDSSGRVLGAHQKLDKVARAGLERILPKVEFPTAKQILHFEGKNGPDGIKRKSPAKDEPWHYYNPTDHSDVGIINMVEHHSRSLTEALRKKNHEKAAFEAAWLAHAIVDGLTPAHHYPLEDKLEELRGEGLETRTTIKDKLLVRQQDDNRRQLLSKNWQFWGAKGIMTTHLLFELGVAVTIGPLKMVKASLPDENELVRARSEGIIPQFKEAALKIYSLKMYERFHKKGWTGKLAKQTKRELAPLIAKLVILAWYDCAIKAGLSRR